MYFFLKYLVTLFYKKLRIKIVVSFLCESGPRDMFKIVRFWKRLHNFEKAKIGRNIVK